MGAILFEFIGPIVYNVGMERMTELYSNETELIGERQVAISEVVKSYRKVGVIKQEHLAGPIIDLFSHVGTVVSILRPYGGKFTIVELDEESVKEGINRKFIDPNVDEIEAGVNAIKYISSRAENGNRVDMITCFGTGDWYFDYPLQFHTDAMNCLNPGGLLLMTGTLHMKELFRMYERNYGGRMMWGGMSSHSWDTYRYSNIKK